MPPRQRRCPTEPTRESQAFTKDVSPTRKRHLQREDVDAVQELSPEPTSPRSPIKRLNDGRGPTRLSAPGNEGFSKHALA